MNVRLKKTSKLITKARWYASNGFSRAVIADKLGVHPNSVDAWLRDQPRRSLQRLRARVAALSEADRAFVVGQ